MPDILEPPGAPAAPPAAPAASTPTIRVSQMPSPAAPAAAPKPGSAKDRLFDSLRAKATTPGAAPEPKPAAAQTPPAAAAPPAAAPPAGEPATPAEPAATPPATATPEDKKKNPWRLVDEYKQRLTRTETELAEVKKSAIPEAQRQEQQKQFEALQTRNRELENEIRFVNYQKSKEFQEQYQAPYEAAWRRAMSEMAEINVISDETTGARRPATAQDLLNLMNMPLAEAQETAETMFGNLASYVMNHRKELRSLFDVQQEQLEKVKKEGAERDQQLQQQTQVQRETTQKFVKETWDKAITEAENDPTYGKYFKPIEGDQDGNQRLAKGFELVDQAFSVNPLDPRLTPEQRAQVVRKHAAVRNRAAAAGRLIAWNRALEEKLSAALEELKQYKASTPPTTAPSGTPPPAGGRASAWDTVRAGLQKYAK